jgi:hypothetical protein
MSSSLAYKGKNGSIWIQVSTGKTIGRIFLRYGA